MSAATSPMRAMRSTTLEASDILTPRQLAERLQVPLSWIYEKTRDRSRWTDGQRMPVLRCGKYMRFSWPEVVEWLRSSGGK
jgi:hypothetical protein